MLKKLLMIMLISVFLSTALTACVREDPSVPDKVETNTEKMLDFFETIGFDKNEEPDEFTGQEVSQKAEDTDLKRTVNDFGWKSILLSLSFSCSSSSVYNPG